MGTHSLRSSSISRTFWQPVAGFAMLNCRQTCGPRERGKGPNGRMGTNGDTTRRQTHRQYPLERTARYWPTDACASQLLALIPASCQLSKSSACWAPDCKGSWNGEAAPRHAASPARTRHRQPSTPRARVLASGPCPVRCNRMPVAICNEQLRPVSERPSHRPARSQAAQRSVARRRRMLPVIVRAHPCNPARPVSDWPSARDTATTQFCRLETPLCPSHPSLPPAARTFIASASHRRMSKLCALVLPYTLFFTDFVCFCGDIGGSFFVFSVSKKKDPSCLLSRPRCASADEVISGVL